MIELAIVLGMVLISFFFIYISFNLQEKHTILKLGFFLLSLVFIYASLTTTSEVARLHTEHRITNSTFNSETGVTEFRYEETHPYENIAGILLSLMSATGYVIFFVTAYLIVLLLSEIYTYIVSQVKR